MSGQPYGPQTPAIRGFLVRLAGLGGDDRNAVVARHAAIASSRAYEAADALLGETITRSGREEARDALSGPLLQLVKRPTAANLTDAEIDAEIELDPIAEPALAALLALMVRDLIDAESLRLLTDAFSDTLPIP